MYDNANIEGGSVLVNNGTTLNVITNSAYTYTTFNASVSGNGDVTRSGDNTSSVNFGADNHLFTGTFAQTGGQTYSNNGFFGGTSNIQGGTLELDAGSHLYSGSNIYLTNGGTTMNVTNYGGKGGGDITLDSGSSIDVGSGTNLNVFSNGTPIDMNTSLSGTGTIYAGYDGTNTYNDSIINFPTDNLSFSGTFDQKAGTSNISNIFFNGNSYIEGNSILNFNSGAYLYQDSHIYLQDTATMNINQGALVSEHGASIDIGAGTTLNINNTSSIDFLASLTGHGATSIVNKNNGGKITFLSDDPVFTTTIKDITYNQYAGTTNLNIPIESTIAGDSTVNLYNGTMVLANESYINGDNLGIYGGTLNTQNGLIGTMALNNFTVGGTGGNWLIDVDLANKIGDNITSASGTGSKLNISNIKLWSDASAPSTAIIVADTNAKGNVSTSVTSVNGALFKYGVSYSGAGANGILNFVKTGVSPNAITSDVAQTSTFLLQTAIDRQFFGNVDAFMSFPLATRESTICCALAHDPNSGYVGGACPITGNGTFSPIYSCDLNRGIWVKDFVSFENIPLRNGPNVSTIEYGTLIGLDASLKDLGHGIAGNTSAYVGYLGSNQNYDQVGVSQNGVLVGLAENMVYKNTFLTLMASVGSSAGNAITPYGNDNFNTLFAGAAVKGGYNFEFKDGEYIIQLNLMLAYTFTNTFDYRTASGLDMNSKPLNAIQVAPGVRLIKNLREEKGQIYLIGSFVYNIMDNTRFTANDVQLPQLSIAPYIEYGVGYQRVWKDRLTGFFQTVLRGGGRNGVALQFGLRWAI